MLDAIRLTSTVGATVRGNRIAARWWGVRVIDCESTVVAANIVTRTTRAVDDELRTIRAARRKGGRRSA